MTISYIIFQLKYFNCKSEWDQRGDSCSHKILVHISKSITEFFFNFVAFYLYYTEPR